MDPFLRIYKREELDDLIVFTDGACSFNGRSEAKGGYGLVFPGLFALGNLANDTLEFSAPLEGPMQTNTRAEYTAVIKALEIANRIDPSGNRRLWVYTDSQILVRSMTEWLPLWVSLGWTKKDGSHLSNVDLLKKLHSQLSLRAVSFRHVKAHTDCECLMCSLNSQADRLAKKGRERESADEQIPSRCFPFSGDNRLSEEAMLTSVFTFESTVNLISRVVVNRLISERVISERDIRSFYAPRGVISGDGHRSEVNFYLRLKSCGKIHEFFVIDDFCMQGLLVFASASAHSLGVCVCDALETWKFLYPKYMARGGLYDRVSYRLESH